MSSEWPLVEIDQVCELIVDCVNKTAPVVAEVTPYRMIRTTNVRRGRIDLGECRYVEQETYQKWTRRAKLRRDDVVLTREAPIGEVGLVTEADGVFLGQRLMQYRANPQLLDSRFLLYSFLSPSLQQQFGSHEGSGSVVSHIRVGDCFKFKLALPPLTIQKEIAALLGALDARITLLHETNITLEAIAQALFKSWFVDFDPVRAKMEGRPPEGMEESTAALFPEDLEEGELGVMPKGWKVKRLSEVLKAKNERVEDMVVPEYASTNDGLVLRSSIYKKQLAASSAKNKVIRTGDLVFGLSRQVLNFGQMADEIGSVSSAYKVYQVNGKEIIPSLLGRLIRTRTEYFFNAVSASSREGQSVSSEALAMLAFVCPPAEIQHNLWNNMAPLLERGRFCIEQAKLLSELRDILLPRLISGQLRLADMETQIEALAA